jgi:peptide chain release factor 1
MVSTGDRSAKIRTYNFPQSRVTDHRINLSLYNLDTVLEGDLDLLLEPLMQYDREAKLKAQGEGLL